MAKPLAAGVQDSHDLNVFDAPLQENSAVVRSRAEKPRNSIASGLADRRSAAVAPSRVGSR